MRKGFCKRNSLSERKDKGPGEPKNIPLQGCGPTPSLATPPPPVQLKDQVRLGACFLNQSAAQNLGRSRKPSIPSPQSAWEGQGAGKAESHCLFSPKGTATRRHPPCSHARETCRL